MKRQQERDTPPKAKRGRPSYVNSEENNIRGRHTADNERREGGRHKLASREGGKGSYRPDGHREAHRDRGGDRDFDMGQQEPRMPPKRHKDDRGVVLAPEPQYGHISRAQERERLSNFGGQEYRSLQVHNLNGPASNEAVRDLIIKEFKKFGDFNIRINHVGNERFAILHFRCAEDARDAKHARQNKLIVFDRPVRIEALYGNQGASSKQRQRSVSPDFGLARDNFSNRSSSPPMLGGPRRGVRHGSLGHDGGPLPPRVERGNSNFGNDYITNFDQGGGGGRGPQTQGEKTEGKFPYHLNHIPPEDDDKATRTLFIGNLDHAISEMDLKDLFEQYGVVEEIDIKRPTKGAGNAYAFVKFINLDMAHRAKVDMSGRYIGAFQCKIGYGKVSPSTCLWVGGLGPWIQTETLEREFDRFGAIHRIEWPPGKNYAYVLYDSIDAAQAACQEMRGFPIGGPEKRLRVDFADVTHMETLPSGSPRRAPLPREDPRDNFEAEPMLWDRDSNNRDNREPYNDNWNDNNKGGFNDRSNNRNRGGSNRKDSWQGSDRGDNYRSQDSLDLDFDRFRRDNNNSHDNFDRRGRSPRGGYNGSGNRNYQGGRGRGGANHSNDGPEKRFGGHHDRDYSKHGNNNNHEHSPPNNKRRRRMSPGHGGEGNGPDHPPRNHSNSNGRTRPSPSDRSLSQPMASVDHVDNIVDLAKCLPVVWSGALVLKNSAFAARMHIVSGAVNLVDTLMRDTTTTEMPVLRITQRLRLDQPKLEEVGKRVLTCGPSGHSVLLAKPGSSQALEDSNTNSQIQQRPLKNLVSYLKQKEAAGVITLPPNPIKGRDTNAGILYAFPPCQFGLEFLQKCAPKLNAEASGKEDHLVVVVVRSES